FVLAAAAAYGLVCLAFWIWQDRLLYWPGPPPRVTPASLGLEFEDMSIATRDGESLHAWLVKPSGPAAKRGRGLVCHGNGGSIDVRLELALAFARMGFSTLLFDYRGYGGSTGRTNEEGTYLDAEAVHDRLVADGFAPRSIVAFGESLGGAVAVELALR